MDNKNNRLFYWEVKDFMNKKPQEFNTHKDSLKDSINSILNENKIYIQENFDANTHTANDVSKYLKTLGSVEKKYEPNHPAFGKNTTVNPFALNEYYGGGYGTNTAPAPTDADARIRAGAKVSQQEVAQRQAQAARRRAMSLANLSPEQRQFELQAMGQDMSDISSSDVYKGSVPPEQQDPSKPLSKEEIALRNLEGDIRAKEKQAEAIVDSEEDAAVKPGDYSTATGKAGNTIADRARRMFGVQGMIDRLKGGEQPTPTQPTGQPTGQPTPQVAAPKAEEKDEQLEKWVSSRTKTYARRKAEDVAREEDAITYMKNMDTSKMSSEQRARHAVNLQRAERRLKGAQEKELPTEANIRGEVGKELSKQRQDLASRAAKLPPGTPGTSQFGPPSPTASKAPMPYSERGGTPAAQTPAKAPTPYSERGGTPVPSTTGTPSTTPVPAAQTRQGSAPTTLSGTVPGGNAPQPVAGQQQKPSLQQTIQTTMNNTNQQAQQQKNKSAAVRV